MLGESSMSILDLGIISSFMTIALVCCIIIFILQAYPLHIMSKKANLKNPAFAYIPVLNGLNMFNLANLSFWFYLVAFVPFIGNILILVIFAYVNYKIAKNFGLSEIACILTVLCPLVAYWYIALSDKQLVVHLDSKYLKEEPLVYNRF